jgi:large subunit ribosomal protein L4
MKYEVFDVKGKKTGEVLLPKEIFGVEMNYDLVHQAVYVQTANRREPWAHAKDRSEVRGGGKKPWRQKGTGRARHGSSRSPIWRKGGATFGPRNEKNFQKSITKKMKTKALFMVLSDKAKRNNILIIDEFKIEKPKTKEFTAILNNFPQKDFSNLLILPAKNDATYKSARNVKKVGVIEARNLNVVDLLSYRNLILPKNSIKAIKDTFLKKSE